mmetsp:Transcript_25133/g.36001  ORF Transcript_25133/g.36001 Transcript_25133/m.36001 type:complete len:117 (-) Transcript_25133:671-1021(-)
MDSSRSGASRREDIFCWIFGLVGSSRENSRRADSGRVSGKKKNANAKTHTCIEREMTEIVQWSKVTASKGENANPNMKLAKSIPKLGALHFGGMTSDKEDNATANQETKPVIGVTM